ncbi:MAG TPA: preprotein translocase subunit SecG [Flavobacteriaceae bacterium]|nr:preprotein translocase subunit SecG [Flavobacteriaceae bacterium]MCB9212986.1 preprotein translocase subunit SecG [Alteromonas sp.]HPF10891.1 preprotein translocase subunit SecG [Flavobacteriaceae bacterium]HQU20366.1 preprotein translocase subunit SecG [Flavobacteriaceae bacterium]HQU64258.1 preprotein translocase subunit SecG [Flavobacteriaceae bacterium]
MSTFSIFLVLIIFVAFLLVIVIMVQNPKGGGLSSSFGGSGTQQLGGVKKTTDFLDRSTWTLAIILLALILLSNMSLFSGRGSNDYLQDQVKEVALPDTNTPPADGTSEEKPE